MWLTAKQLQEKYGVQQRHCSRDFAQRGCRTKISVTGNRKTLLYYDPDVKKMLEDRAARREKAEKHYDARPDVSLQTRSQLKKVIDGKMYLKLRNAWYGMMRRCYTNDRPDWHHYRDFHIEVCEEWLDNFDSFALWALNNGVELDLSLDRIDNSRGYTPDNCRWTTRKTQGNNTSFNRVVRFRGEEKTIAEWAEEYGIKYHTLYRRIVVNKWPIEKALTTPVGRR